jgi:S1-C subfamily serine protease
MRKMLLTSLCALLLLSSCTIFSTLVIKNKKDSFVQVLAIRTVKGNDIGISTASGVVVENRGPDTFILTAGHFCLDEDHINKTVKPIDGVFITKLNGDSHKGSVHAISRLWDICLLKAPNLGIKPVRVAAHDNEVGDNAVNIAAPNGLFGKDLIMSYEGRYAGHGGGEFHIEQEVDFYTFPVAPGSSGSPVFNLKGELVGLVFAVDARYHHITLAVTREQIIMFLESVLDLGYIIERPRI